MIQQVISDIFDKGKFFLIAGPCAVESEEICMEVAGTLKQICKDLGIVYIFKASYRKANRTKADSFTGIGDEQALEILKRVGRHFEVPVITDVHETGDVALASGYVDMLQIPAFLCRQTDLLVAAGNSGLPVNIKKGQFMSASSMHFAAEKVTNSGNGKIMLTERGNSFGYSDLIVDFRNIPIMKQAGHPVVLDVTHSVQQPNQGEGVSGGTPAFIETILLSGIVSGADGIFLEAHPDPSAALSDGSNMIALDKVEGLLEKAMQIRVQL
ncbi:MAG: 3-deoxy-8-phosphooctulonate synthase [Bacteroidetes bacterium]|nr:3-deoxy-8-phosphooctulonate synthase [Bacteroidota bacterium]